jgi:hypothetical protein
MTDERKTGEAKAMAAERGRDEQVGRASTTRAAGDMRAATRRTADRLAEKAAEREREQAMEPDHEPF